MKCSDATLLSARLIAALQRGSRALRTLHRACRNHPSPEAVHRLRVAIRRVLAALDLTRDLPAARSRRVARQALRKLLRTLGPARDAAVSRSLAATLRPRPPGMNALELRLRRRTARLAAVLVGSLGPSRPHRAIARHARKLRRAGRGRFDLPAALRGIIAAEARSRQRLAHRWPRSAADDRAFHRARVAVKRRRYLLELLVELGLKPESAEIQRLHQLQRALGEWHDGVVLLERTQNLADRGKISPALAAAVAGMLTRRLVALRRRCLAAGRRLRTASRGRHGACLPPANAASRRRAADAHSP